MCQDPSPRTAVKGPLFFATVPPSDLGDQGPVAVGKIYLSRKRSDRCSSIEIDVYSSMFLTGQVKSPDLNPIEDEFHFLKTRLKAPETSTS